MDDQTKKPRWTHPVPGPAPRTEPPESAKGINGRSKCFYWNRYYSIAVPTRLRMEDNRLSLADEFT